ncbi:hypothetical protein DPF_0402 [Desulfoplanes formicivorans]|uniref:Uncharacterized protein n=1 Tax=Desulfoplanes formicivorans TaxID=1592317 RepID=A0A194AF36_9BACT|nr:hypothetical protein DPF_0402 [Desulfoplanes formicivorans]
MIEVDQMAELVDQNVLNQFGGDEEKLGIKTYGSLCRTASPSGFLISDLNAGKPGQSVFLAHLFQPRGKVDFALQDEPSFQKG